MPAVAEGRLAALDRRDIALGALHETFAAGRQVGLDMGHRQAQPRMVDNIEIGEIAGREVQGRVLNPRPVRPGEVREFVRDLSRLHIFDGASGRSLRA